MNLHLTVLSDDFDVLIQSIKLLENCDLYKNIEREMYEDLINQLLSSQKSMIALRLNTALPCLFFYFYLWIINLLHGAQSQSVMLSCLAKE